MQMQLYIKLGWLNKIKSETTATVWLSSQDLGFLSLFQLINNETETKQTESLVAKFIAAVRVPSAFLVLPNFHSCFCV